MLQSFIGTFDAAGLRTLRHEEETTTVVGTPTSSCVQFWAILDSEELLPIHKAIHCGERETALELIIRQAKSLGQLNG